MNALEFVDAQEMARLHPDTFEAPLLEELNTIKTGSMVKVCTGGERFWVAVVSVDGQRITGEVNNNLICTQDHGLDCGNMITFEARHVYSIWQGGAA